MGNFGQGNRQRQTSYSNYSAGKSFGGGNKVNHKATCAQCKSHCTVPFKPTGSKPVLCRDCFRGSEGNSRDRRSNDRPSYQRSERRSNDRPSFERRPAKAKPAIGPTLKEEIKGINEKLSRILVLLGEKSEPVLDIIKEKKSAPEETKKAESESEEVVDTFNFKD
jgi:CxxC-x17-CxxC domain-containing protein